MGTTGVLVGISGGVDSIFAARQLVNQGYRVESAYLRSGYEDPAAPAQAAELAAALAIPFHLVDVSEAFRTRVIENFRSEYRAGRTPNPCVLCNKVLKFSELLREADRRAIELIATGHYARVLHDGDTGQFHLFRGVDREKDQSYFLCRLGQEELSRTLLPNGTMIKRDVVESVRRWHPAAAAGRESQEVCFIPDGDYCAFLEESPGFGPPSPGDIVNRKGLVLGRHRGIHTVTIGQRRGLSIASERPYYVLAIDPGRNRVVVGRDEEQYAGGLTAQFVSWTGPDACPSEPREVTTCIRYRHNGVRSVLTPSGPGGREVSVMFEKPQKAVAPGQAAVFYDGDRVLGGGIIQQGIARG